MSDKDFPFEPTDGRPLFDLDAWTETRSVTMPQAELDALRAENERLRAALEAIIDKGQTGDYMERAPLVGIALEALGRS